MRLVPAWLLLALTATAAETPQGKLYPSRRCGECHGRQREEWQRSAHARAASGAYVAALASVPEGARAACAGCHVPLEGAGSRVAADGVGCDACHTATAAGDGGTALTLSPQLATRFGPYSDAKDHHFHRVSASTFVTGGGLCNACHEDLTRAALRTYTTVSEWRDVKGAKACIDCHMPGFKAIAAKGEKERPVSHHDFGPRADAVTMKVIAAKGALDVELLNSGADHALPTGRPERRLLLEVAWLDAKGEKLSAEQRRFGRVLVDAAGKAAPSFLAVKEASDNRLLPKKPAKESFKPVAGAVKAWVRLWWEPFDPALAVSFDATSSAPRLMSERREALK